jgi:adenylate cyclase
MAGEDSAAKRIRRGLLAGFASAAVALLFWASGGLVSWEAKTWDWRVKIMARPGEATDRIRLILLDQNSLDWALKENGLSWPWPREVYSAVVNFCKRHGAKALAFDVLFTEPSKYGVEDDAALGGSVSDYGRFVGTVFLGRESGRETEWPQQVPRPNLNVSGLKQWLSPEAKRILRYPKASFPITELAAPSAVLSNVHLDPDPDGTYRRVKLLGLFDGSVLPALGLAAFLAGSPAVPIAIEKEKLSVGVHAIPVDGFTNTILRYRGTSGAYKTYSAAAVLQSEIRLMTGEKPTLKGEHILKNKYVLFGFSAPGLYDLKPTPVGGVYPGVEIQATLLDNLLSNDFMSRSPKWLDISLLMLLSLSCTVLLSIFSSPLQSVVISTLTVLIPIALSLFMYHTGYWLSLVVEEIGVFGAILTSLVVNYATEGRQKRFIKNAFKQYLNPDVIDQLIKNPSRLKLGGERKDLSIFFSDLQGFTTISEGLDPETLTTFLNEYLSAMTDIIREEGGTVDKYEGDAIIAFWNAPLEVEDHAIRSVRTALRCQMQLKEMRPVFRNRIGKDILMRIGINTGPVVVGNLGSDLRFDYTVLGDAVNLASRLEGANKEFGTYTMISESTRSIVGDMFPARELGRLVVVGKKEPVTVYEPMMNDSYEQKKYELQTFSEALDLFYKGNLRQAQTVFSSISNSDPAAKAYMQRCSLALEFPSEHPRGLWIMTRK